MQTNKINYVCFFVVCCMVLLDIYLSTNIALQMVCILLCVVCVGLGVWVAVKHAKGAYYTNEQAHNLQNYLSENIALNALNKALRVDVQQAKKLALSSPELQNTILQNKRLTVQNSNLKLHLVQLSEQLQTAKNSKQTAVVPITPNEQKQTASNNKAKTA